MVQLEIVPRHGAECFRLWRALVAPCALFLGGLDALPHLVERRGGIAPGLGGLDCRIGPDRELSQPAMEAIERAPALASVFGDAQSKSRKAASKYSTRPRVGGLTRSTNRSASLRVGIQGLAGVTPG